MNANTVATSGLISGGKYGAANLIASGGLVNILTLSILKRSSFPFSVGGKRETRSQQIIREDEEILMFIKAFMERWDP